MLNSLKQPMEFHWQSLNVIKLLSVRKLIRAYDLIGKFCQMTRRALPIDFSVKLKEARTSVREKNT